MAIVHERSLFNWRDFHNETSNLGDLERLQLVIETMPDDKLMHALYELRGQGRNDFPIGATWNSILAGIVFQHASVESLRRELQRNAQFREMCGFNPILGVDAVPSKSAYSRFLAKLLTLEPLVREMFDSLVNEIAKIIPHFGKNLAGDGKAIHSFGKPVKKKDGDRNLWKDGEETRQLKTKKIQNITYDYKGTVFCHCPKTGEVRRMTYTGFEKERESLKYSCPAFMLAIAVGRLRQQKPELMRSLVRSVA